MKKILVISTLFLLTTIAQLFAVEFTFLDVNDKVVEYLNSVRSNPMDYIVNKSLDQSKIKNSWGDNYYNYFSSDLGGLIPISGCAGRYNGIMSFQNEPAVNKTLVKEFSRYWESRGNINTSGMNIAGVFTMEAPFVRDMLGEKNMKLT